MNLFSTLFSQNKTSAEATKVLTAPLIEFHLTQAHFLFKLDDFQTTIHHCNEVLALDPTQAKAYQLRGISRYELQDFKGASEDIRLSLSLS